jgi:uncharacterized protein (TIGR01777 family)
MPMRILVTGSTGLVGSALVRELTAAGHRVLRLVRTPPQSADDVHWDPAAGRLDTAKLHDLEAVVHLAGESIAEGRWDAAKKARIRDSRVVGTSFLAESLALLPQLPKALVCASAVGYYGDRGDEVLREDSAPGTGFLADVCRAWEAAADPARAAGIRVVHLRLGVVLAKQGGALAKMLPPFRWGLGGRLGPGTQYMSWIALDDLVAILRRAIEDANYAGPINAVAPEAVTSAQFARVLGKVLRRPAFLPAPAAAIRLLLGEMADALLLSSARVEPARLSALGYRFAFPSLEGALRHLV